MTAKEPSVESTETTTEPPAGSVTIAELAASLGLAKPTVRKRLKSLGLYDKCPPNKRRVRMVPPAVASALADELAKNPVQTRTASPVNDELVEALREQIDVLETSLARAEGRYEDLHRIYERLDERAADMEAELKKVRSERDFFFTLASTMYNAPWWRRLRGFKRLAPPASGASQAGDGS